MTEYDSLSEKHFLDNNIDLYFLTNEHLHTFCISVYILAGSMYETKNVNGISHLYEHMVFRNLCRIYNNEFYSMMGKNGLYLNACTYKEFIRFSITGITSSINIAADVLSNLLIPMEISDCEFDVEKRRIYAEIREENDKKSTSYRNEITVWENTSCAMTILGNKTSVSKITLNRLNKYRDMVISAGNVFVYVTGNVGTDGERLIRNAVKAIPVSSEKLYRNNTAPVPENFGNRNNLIDIKNETYSIVCLSFDVDTLKHRTAVTDILYRVLFTGDDALINDSLSEKNAYAYSFSCFLEQYSNIGRFYLNYEVDKEKTVKSVSEVVNAVNKIKAGDFDLETQINKELNNFAFMLDDPDELNFTMAYNYHILKGKNIDLYEDLKSRYKNITKESVSEAAKDIFTKKNLTLTIKGNKKKINVEEIDKITELLN